MYCNPHLVGNSLRRLHHRLHRPVIGAMVGRADQCSPVARPTPKHSITACCSFFSTGFTCYHDNNLDNSKQHQQQHDHSSVSHSSSSNASSSSTESSSTEPMFLRRLFASLRELESSVGFSQRTLQSKLHGSMPLFTKSSEKSSQDGDDMVQSLQLKLALTSMDSDMSSKPFSNKSHLDKIQRKLFEEQQALCNELAALDDSSNVRSFGSVRPREAFLVLLVAHMMNPRLLATVDQQSEPVRKHLFMLLNIIQLTRDGAHTRVDADDEQYPGEDMTNADNHSEQAERYRWSILKGNFYFYNMTYSLLRLNMKNVTKLMSASLQDITAIQYWLEKEAITRLTRQPSPPPQQQLQSVINSEQGQQQLTTTTMTPSVRVQLATGQLMSVWQWVVASRDASLLSNGCQAAAYLLGKDSPTEYQVAHQLGTILATILSLVDDYCYIKSECQSDHSTIDQHDPPEQWSPTRHFNFLLRLPVLLYLKEANTNTELNLPLAETNCSKIVRNVIANIEQSEALAKTEALIEHHVSMGQQLVGRHYEPTKVRQDFLALLHTCASIK